MKRPHAGTTGVDDAAAHSSLRGIWRLVWPILLYNVLELTVGVADLVMVRSLGTDATAAVGVCRQITFLIEAVAIGITASATTRVSQAVGAGDPMRIRQLVVHNAYVVLACGLSCSLVGWLLLDHALSWLNVGSARDAAAAYLSVYMVGFVFSWGTLMATAILRGCGNVMTPLKIAVVMNLLNIGLNYMFIHGAGPVPAYGVAGAAMGTVIARAVAMILFLWVGVIRRRDRKRDPVSLSVSVGEVWLAIRLGSPLGAAALLRTGARLVYLSIVGAFVGTSLQAAVGIGMQLRLFGVLPALAFQVAINTLVGQAVGRRDEREARLVARRALGLLAGVMLVVTSGLVIFSGPLARLVVASPADADLAAYVVRWFAVAQVFSALAIGAQGILMGRGDNVPALSYTVVSQWLILLPTAGTVAWIGWLPGGLMVAWTVAPTVMLILFLSRIRTAPPVTEKVS